MKLLIALVLLVNLSGCAWIALDRYYGTDGSNDQWASEFRPGKTSTKMSGYPDTQLHSFIKPEFKLTVNISYQDIGAFGPVIVPIIPTPWDSSRELRIVVEVYTESEIEVDFSSWQITTGEESHSPQIVSVVGMDESPLGKIKLEKNSTILVYYQLKVADIDSLSVNFGPFLKGKKSIEIPALNLLKFKGTWHYEVWTV